MRFCVPLAVIFPSVVREPAQKKSVWPLEIKNFETYVWICLLKYIKTGNVSQVVTFLTYLGLISSNFNRVTNDVDWKRV
jgi:hypothetical protein